MALAFSSRLQQAARFLSIGNPWARNGQTAPLPGDAKGLARLLSVSPRPLVHPDARLIVIFSPKSACTNVTVWFLHQIGHIKAARDYNNWPHKYRLKVYYDSALYRKARGLNLKKFKVIRVVRDPYDRAASGFRHAVKTEKMHADIAKELGLSDIATKGLSFDQYLTYLERLDLTNCNPHFRVQRHPIEDALPVHHLINISKQDLFKRLGEIETEVGLPPASAEMTDWLHRLRNHRRPQQPFADVADLQTLPLTQEQAIIGPWPASDALLNPQTRRRIEKCYAIDIKSYL